MSIDSGQTLHKSKYFILEVWLPCELKPIFHNWELLLETEDVLEAAFVFDILSHPSYKN